MSVLVAVMNEYAEAIRGDWSSFDGRTMRDVIGDWVGEIENPSDRTVEEWRDMLGLCPDGGGHWAESRRGKCDPYECPIQAEREAH